MRRFLIVFLLLISACTDRTLAPLVPSAVNIGTVEPVFVATTRAENAAGNLGKERSEVTHFLRADVSIPPNRKSGTIKTSALRPDPQEHFVLSALHNYATGAEFRTAIRQEIAKQPPGERDVVLYVHGYNNSFSDGVFRAAQLMHDLQTPGVAVHFSWPSAMNPLGYTYDRDSLLYSRDALEHLLVELKASGVKRIVIIGHSMGSMLIMETLRQIEIRSPGWTDQAIGGVILISPDIDVDLFRAQTHRFANLPQPFAIFTSKRDRVLQLSARVNGNSNRLGSVTDAAVLADLPVTLVDVSDFSSNAAAGHFTVGTSPALIAILTRSAALDEAFQRDRSGRTGLIQGTVLSVQNATELILSPGLLRY